MPCTMVAQQPDLTAFALRSSVELATGTVGADSPSHQRRSGPIRSLSGLASAGMERRIASSNVREAARSCFAVAVAGLCQDYEVFRECFGDVKWSKTLMQICGPGILVVILICEQDAEDMDANGHQRMRIETGRGESRDWTSKPLR